MRLFDYNGNDITSQSDNDCDVNLYNCVHGDYLCPNSWRQTLK